MNIIILTGNEKRHEYFRKRISLNEKIHVLSSYCEGNERSLENRTLNNEKSHLIEIQHINARKQSEEDFFGLALSNMSDNSNPNFIKKGDINLNDFYFSKQHLPRFDCNQFAFGKAS